MQRLAMSEGIVLSTEVTESHGIPIVRVQGDIDLHTVPRFERAVQEGIDRARSTLIIDLSGATYLDSAGLSALLSANKKLSTRDAKLYVIAPRSCPGVRRVLEITRIDTIIPVYESLEDVLSAIQLPKAA